MIVTLPDSVSKDIGDEDCTIEEILRRFSLDPAGVVVSLNGRVVPEDAVAGGDDRVRIIRIAHGG